VAFSVSGVWSIGPAITGGALLSARMVCFQANCTYRPMQGS